jgi:hypothetical protein
MEFNSDKFKALVHYICYRADRADLGATKLNKTLWYADLWTYLMHGTSMTGEGYIKQQFGPVPKHILSSLEELQTEGKIAVRDAEFFRYEKKEYIALKRPDLSLFSGEEISIVDELINMICRGHTARSISDKTHDRIWELADIGEEIPYYTAFAGSLGEIDQNDITWAHRSISEDATA